MTGFLVGVFFFAVAAAVVTGIVGYVLFCAEVDIEDEK